MFATFTVSKRFGWFPVIVFNPKPSPPKLSHRAGEIYNTFLSSKATMPVNIDSQAQLADDVLTSPRPDMFKTQQLQVPRRAASDQTSCFRPDILSSFSGHLGLFTKGPRAFLQTDKHTVAHAHGGSSSDRTQAPSLRFVYFQPVRDDMSHKLEAYANPGSSRLTSLPTGVCF